MPRPGSPSRGCRRAAADEWPLQSLCSIRRGRPHQNWDSTAGVQGWHQHPPIFTSSGPGSARCSDGVSEYISPVPPATTIAAIGYCNTTLMFFRSPAVSIEKSELNGVTGNAIAPWSLERSLSAFMELFDAAWTIEMPLSGLTRRQRKPVSTLTRLPRCNRAHARNRLAGQMSKVFDVQDARRGQSPGSLAR